jgi:hypothetical protein
MATRRQRRPGEREEDAGNEGEEQEEGKPVASPIDVETIAALRAADPNTRKFSLLRIQRLHGNATVQRLMRELESTDASRDGRIQQLGERAEEPVPSGAMEKSILYRSMMESEIEAVPLDGKSEGEIVQDDVNTIGEIFANYQTAMHMFESVIGSDGASESVPREAVQDFISDFTEKFFREILDVDLDAIPFLYDRVEEAIGFADEPSEDIKPHREEGQPTNSLRNLALAERERLASEHRDMLKGQRGMMRGAVEDMSTIDPDRRNEEREELARIASEVNRMEMTTHSAEWLFRQILDAWKDELRDTSIVIVDIDEQWNVRRAHIRGRDGKKLATQLLGDNSGVFDLNELRLSRVVRFRPAEMAEVEVQLAPNGDVKGVRRNDKGGDHVEEILRRLNSEGLPETRILSGD